MKTTAELVKQLRQLADIGIVNAYHDTEILRMAADRLEDQEERIAIMAEGNKFAIDANFEEDENAWN